jgi:hypothetical protein
MHLKYFDKKLLVWGSILRNLGFFLLKTLRNALNGYLGKHFMITFYQMMTENLGKSTKKPEKSDENWQIMTNIEKYVKVS